MSFDMDKLVKDNRRIWLDKMKKKDPSYARYFCDRCIAYIGAAKECDCE